MDDKKLENINCDWCDSSNFQIIFNDVIDNELNTPGKFNVGRCIDCGLVYLNPRPKPEYIGECYPDNYVPYQKEGGLILVIKKILWLKTIRNIKKLIKPGDSILEIGCSNGDFLHMLQGSDYKLYGLEINKNCIKAAKELYNLKIWHGRFEDFVFDPNIKFNFIIMNYTLEHLASPKAVFSKLKSITAPKAYQLISVPNYESWEQFIFKKYWHCLDVPRHFYIFSDKTMQRYVKESGFEIIETKYSFMPNDWIGSVGRFLKEANFSHLGTIFNVKNRVLASFFLPFSVCAGMFGKSSRFTFILRKYEKI